MLVFVVRKRLLFFDTFMLRLSVSYARDFYCGAASTGRATAESILPAQTTSEEFSNMDGIYASNNVKRGCVVLTESQLPGCSLPRSATANCMISQVQSWNERLCRYFCHLTSTFVQLPSGEMCLVASENIRAGDWLSVYPSDSSDSDE